MKTNWETQQRALQPLSNAICMRLRINETIRAHKHQMEMEVGKEKLKQRKKRRHETIENTGKVCVCVCLLFKASTKEFTIHNKFYPSLPTENGIKIPYSNPCVRTYVCAINLNVTANHPHMALKNTVYIADIADTRSINMCARV